MLSREFKFRHANEIAGLFVILSFALLVGGIFLAGSSQGWFSPRVTLRLLFETPEDTLGLQEGATVLVRSTVAGRVTLLEPTAEGKIEAIVKIREQFQSFITVDSTARIKRTFVVSGDAYVEIVPGSGAMIADDGVLQVVQEEALLETAQRMLEEMQANLAPMFTRVETIISNTASILERVDEGEGLVGALISDGELRDATKGIVLEAEGATRDARGLIGQVTRLLDHEVQAIAEQTTAVQRELERTLSESRRVVEAFQRHWLIRRYVKDDTLRLPLLPGGPFYEADEKLQADLTEELVQARLADAAADLVRSSYNLAVYALAVGALDLGERLLYECLVAARRLEVIPAEVRLLQAEWLRISGKPDYARALLGEALDVALGEGRRGRQQSVLARLSLASLALEANDVDMARNHIQDIKRTRGDVLEDSLIQAALAGVEARIGIVDGNLKLAGAFYQRQADLLRGQNAYDSMATALLRSGDLLYNAGDFVSSAESYLRAGSSLSAQQQYDRVLAVLSLAERAADASGDAMLTQRVQDMRASIGEENL